MSKRSLLGIIEPSTFRQNVVEIVALIPDGRVLSYGDVATLAGSARAARAVGTILKTANEDLPWHRVINSTMAVSGSHFDGRPLRQIQLLQAEGHTIGHQGRIHDPTCRWPLEDAYDAWHASGASTPLQTRPDDE